MAAKSPPNSPVNSAMADALANASAKSQGQQQKPPQPQVQQQTPPPSAQSMNQSNAAPRNTRRASTVVDVNSTLRRPMSRNSSGEFVLKFANTLKPLMQENLSETSGDAFRLLTLDNNSANVALSALLVCYHERAQGGLEHVAVYTLLIEASGGRLQNQQVNIGGVQVEVESVTGDVYYVDSYWEQIQALLIETYGRQLQVHDAGCLVLPSEMETDDAHRLRQVLYNATQANFTIMDNVLGGAEEPFSVAFVDANDSLTARLDFGSAVAETATGLPVRADIVTTLQGAVVNTQQQQGGYQQVRDLTMVASYIDLTFVPPPPPAFGQQPSTKSYFPRQVITRADTAIDAITLELQLLALGTATLPSRNHAFYSTWKPNLGVSGIDLKDIGAVGWEVNLTGDPTAKSNAINTKDNAFGIPQLQTLLNAVIHDGLIYSMDIEEVGELSWIHQTYIAAANGAGDARQSIIDAANNLTLNKFGQLFPQNEAVCQDDQNRIHLGYYTTQSGERRDLRDLDYLAVLNLTGRDNPNVIQEWEETFVNTSIPLELRLDKRVKLMRGMVAGSLVIKGFARRITFNPNFIAALTTAIEQAGLTIRPANLVETFNGASMRGNYNVAQWAVSGQQVQGLFNYSAPGQVNSRLFGQPFGGRFNR